MRRALAAVALAAVALAACGPGRSPSGPDEPTAAAPLADPTADRTAPGDPAGPGDDPAADAPPSPDDLRIAAIEKAVNDTRDTRHECWAFAAADNYHVEGRVVLSLAFGDGDTARVSVVGDEPGDARLTECLGQLYGAYRWPAGVFDAGVTIELPFSFKAPRYQYTVAASYVEPRTLAGGKVTAQPLLHEANTGNGAVALTTITASGGLELPLHRHDRAAEVIYVVSGRGRIFGLDGRRRGTRIAAGHAVYIPAGTAHGFVHEGEEPIQLVQLYTPSGPDSRFRGGPPVDMIELTADEIRERPRRFPRPIVQTRPTVYEGPGGARFALYFDPAITGDPAASLTLVTAPAGGTIPPHRHARETEVLWVTGGEAVTTVAGDRYPTGPMTAVQIPAGVEHAAEFVGAEPVRGLQFYAPAGPEQRYKGAR